MFQKDLCVFQTSGLPEIQTHSTGSLNTYTARLEQCESVMVCSTTTLIKKSLKMCKECWTFQIFPLSDLDNTAFISPPPGVCASDAAPGFTTPGPTSDNTCTAGAALPAGGRGWLHHPARRMGEFLLFDRESATLAFYLSPGGKKRFWALVQNK